MSSSARCILKHKNWHCWTLATEQFHKVTVAWHRIHHYNSIRLCTLPVSSACTQRSKQGFPLSCL